MRIMELTGNQIIYIVIASVVVAVIIFCAIFFPLRKLRHVRKFRDHYYKKIYSIAFDRDYYLINNFLFRVEDNKVACIDHLLFGDKYIYLISDLYYDGNLSGSYDDKSLIYMNNKGKKAYTDNPFEKSERLMKRLCSVTSQNPSIMIGIVLVNDDCKLDIQSESDQFFICQRKKLSSLIKEIENRENVGVLNAELLARAVKSIDKLNRKKKTK